MRSGGGSGPVATFSAPNSTTSTVATGINDGNVIVGYYDTGYRGGQTSHAFIRDSSGTFETLDYPGAISTSAFAIGNTGEIAGYFDDAEGLSHGFLAKPFRGVREERR